MLKVHRMKSVTRMMTLFMLRPYILMNLAYVMKHGMKCLVTHDKATSLHMIMAHDMKQ